MPEKGVLDWTEVERLAAMRVLPSEIAAILAVPVARLDEEARARGHGDFLSFWVRRALESSIFLREGLSRLARAGNLEAAKLLNSQTQLESELLALLHSDASATHRKRGDVAKLKAQYVRLLRAGWLRGAAARHIGVDRTTIWRWRKADPQFDQACQEAEAAAVEAVEDALYRAALDGNVTAMQVILYNRAPDRWADRRQIAVRPTPVETLGPDAQARLEAILRKFLNDGAGAESSRSCN